MIKGKHVLIKVIVIGALFFSIHQCFTCIVSHSTSDTEFKLGKFEYRLLGLNASYKGENQHWLDIYLEDAEKMSCKDICEFMGLFFKNYKLETDAFYDPQIVDSILQDFKHHEYAVEIVGTNVIEVYNTRKIEHLVIENGKVRCVFKHNKDSCKM